MLDVDKFLNEIGYFIKKAKADLFIVDLTSGWDVSEEVKDKHPFMTLKDVHVNSGAVTLAEVVEREMSDVKSGKDVIVILADNRQHRTKMEYFQCNIAKSSELTAKQIVSQANVKFFEGENYYDEAML